MRISDWSSDVCSSDLSGIQAREIATDPARLLSCERPRKLLDEPPLFQGQGTPRRVRCCHCASVLGIQLPGSGLHYSAEIRRARVLMKLFCFGRPLAEIV